MGKSGISVSELFPHIATCVDDITVIRSMVSGFPLHPRANLLMHTGRNIGGYPSLGSWVNYALGSENKNLPGYVLLHAGAVPPGGLENFSNGFLPATYQATAMQAEGKPVVNIDPADKDPQDSARQAGRSAPAGPAISAIRRTRRRHRVGHSELRNGVQMQSVVPDVLNLDKESEATKRLYGLDAADKNKRLYSLQCLRARRLDRIRRSLCRDHLPGSPWREQRHLGPAFRTEERARRQRAHHRPGRGGAVERSEEPEGC